MSVDMYAVCDACRVYAYVGKDYRFFGYGSGCDLAPILAFIHAHSTHETALDVGGCAKRMGVRVVQSHDLPSDDVRPWLEWEWDEDDNKSPPVRHYDGIRGFWQHRADRYCVHCDEYGYRQIAPQPVVQ